MTTIEIYKKMLAYLLDNNMADDYACIARRTGINEAQISRVRNGKVKRVKEDTMRKINASYGNIFNPEWMRGESDIMLMADLDRQNAEDDTDMHQSATMYVPDKQTMLDFNSFIAAKDEAYDAMRGKLESKDETIAELRGRLADKDALIQEKERTINRLQQLLYELQSEKGLPFSPQTTGVAEHPAQHRP